MLSDLKDKTVIITGSSKGVGAATARKFAAEGANLVLVARGRRELEEIADELAGQTRVLAVPMDVTDNVACVNLLKKADFEFGGVHVLVNNAGLHVRGPLESIDFEDLSGMIDVNLAAPICLCRHAIPYMKRVDRAAIVNVASLAGRTAISGAATYCASKFGLRAFSIALAQELVDTNIKIAVVSPGPIDTGSIMDNIDVATDATFSQPISTPDEVADEILKIVQNDKFERSMPPTSGLLTMLTYVFPFFGRWVRPLMERKGRSVKRKLKAEFKAAEEYKEKQNGRQVE